MFKKTLVCSIFVFTIILPSLTAFAKQPSDYPVIEYAYPDQSIWTIKRDAKGVLDNPLLRLAKTMFSEAGLKWNANPYPAKRMFRRLIKGETPFSMLVRAPALKECCLFSEAAVTSTELRVYRRKGTPEAATKEDLKGQKVITIQGYSYGGIGRYLRDKKNGVDINTAKQHEEAFSMLNRGRADYVLDYTGPSKDVLAMSPIPGIQYNVLTRLDVYLVLSKSYPDANELMIKLENIVKKLDRKKILSDN